MKREAYFLFGLLAVGCFEGNASMYQADSDWLENQRFVFAQYSYYQQETIAVYRHYCQLLKGNNKEPVLGDTLSQEVSESGLQIKDEDLNLLREKLKVTRCFLQFVLQAQAHPSGDTQEEARMAAQQMQLISEKLTRDTEAFAHQLEALEYLVMSPHDIEVRIALQASMDVHHEAFVSEFKAGIRQTVKRLDEEGLGDSPWFQDLKNVLQDDSPQASGGAS